MNSINTGILLSPRRITYFVLAVVSFIFNQSCKRDSDKLPQFPTKLNLVQVRKKEGIRLFVGKNQVIDPNVKKEFVYDLNYFGVRDTSVTSEEGIVFHSADSASIDQLMSELSVKAGRDTLFFESVSDVEFPEEAATVIYPMQKYRNPLGPWWYDHKYRMKARLVGQGNYSKLMLPFFNYKLVKTRKFMGEVYRYVWSGKVSNDFDETYINNLEDADTLAVEKYIYVFERK